MVIVPRSFHLGFALLVAGWLVPLSAAPQGPGGLVVQRAANDRISIQAQDVTVDDVLTRLAETLDADIVGLETIPTDRRVTGRIELPLDRILAWLAPDASYAMYWSPSEGWENGGNSAKRLRIVFFPEGQAGGAIPSSRSGSFRGFGGAEDAGVVGEPGGGLNSGAVGRARAARRVVPQASGDMTSEDPMADPTVQDPMADQDTAVDQGLAPEQDPTQLQQGYDQGAISDPMSQQPY
jgi:hypothetical protein